MDDPEQRHEMTESEWSGIVYSVLADHPEWTAATVNAVQGGVVQAIERQKDRVSVLSWGLHQALSTTRKAKRRQRQKIVDAIEMSNLHPTVWSKAMIQKEQESGE